MIKRTVITPLEILLNYVIKQRKLKVHSFNNLGTHKKNWVVVGDSGYSYFGKDVEKCDLNSLLIAVSNEITDK
jgi:hypothetical protein